MTQWLRCLLHNNHENLSSNPSTHITIWTQFHHTCHPSAVQSRHRRIAGTYCLTASVKKVSSGFRERPCLKEKKSKSGKQRHPCRLVASACTFTDVCICTHTCEYSIHIHPHTQYEEHVFSRSLSLWVYERDRHRRKEKGKERGKSIIKKTGLTKPGAGEIDLVNG